ncbi:MAG: hypothetical protein PHU01_12465, partial [Desulfuromonadaceae bacterium]|nr:hypothetical protein [Desulfuromonadaceae bacterium]
PTEPGTETMISRIVEDSLGNIWFCSDFGYGVDGIYCYNKSGNWIKYSDGPVNDIGLRAHDIAAGSDGTVWFGSVYSGAGAILRYDPAGGGVWTRFTQAELGLDSGEVHGLAVDGTGLWFITAYNPGITGNGTGAHYLSFTAQNQPIVTHYTYRGDSSSLTALRFNQIAADKSGGVWFPAYDDPSIARLKADGSWQQFRQAGNVGFGSFGVVGAAADSNNIVYFAPLRSVPVAYDVTAEQWLTLPAEPFTDFYYYGVYVDPDNGKWFYGAYGVYYLNPDNTAWTSFAPAELPGFPADYYIEDVLVDKGGNVWFICRSEVVLMKKGEAGGAATWFRFTNGNDGFSSGYGVTQDDSGQVWNVAKQKFDSLTNTWVTVDDTSAFDQRNLQFLNGTVPAGMDLTNALSPLNSWSGVIENLVTIDTKGTLYFSAGLGSVSGGIAAFGLLPANGICGSYDAQSYPVAPSANLCSSGAASVVTGIGPWSWSCTGSNGGGAAYCSAELQAETFKPGDCDSNDSVTIAEVQSSINMFLGLGTAKGCVDQDANGNVSIAEVQKVINSFLGI